MDVNSSVNPIQRESVRVDLQPESRTVEFNREPPPPYSSEPTVINQPISCESVVVQPSLKDIPTFYNCPKCEKRILTNVEYFNSRKTHLFAGFICGFTAWCLLCCLGAIPYIIKTCKKAHHHCPNCNTFLGAHSKI